MCVQASEFTSPNPKDPSAVDVRAESQLFKRPIITPLPMLASGKVFVASVDFASHITLKRIRPGSINAVHIHWIIGGPICSTSEGLVRCKKLLLPGRSRTGRERDEQNIVFVMECFVLADS